MTAAAAYCSSTERLEVLPDMIGKTVVGWLGVVVGGGEP
jgi:hypothetical protein